jgi:hypothetical protein
LTKDTDPYIHQYALFEALKTKSHKEVTKQKESGLRKNWLDDRRIRSVPRTYRSGSGRPKKHSDPDPQQLILSIINCMLVPGELATTDAHSALGEEEPHGRW